MGLQRRHPDAAAQSRARSMTFASECSESLSVHWHHAGHARPTACAGDGTTARMQVSVLMWPSTCLAVGLFQLLDGGHQLVSVHDVAQVVDAVHVAARDLEVLRQVDRLRHKVTGRV